MELQKTLNSKDNLNKEKYKARKVKLPDHKTQYKATVIKAGKYCIMIDTETTSIQVDEGGRYQS